MPCHRISPLYPSAAQLARLLGELEDRRRTEAERVKDEVNGPLRADLAVCPRRARGRMEENKGMEWGGDVKTRAEMSARRLVYKERMKRAGTVKVRLPERTRGPTDEHRMSGTARAS